MRIAKPLTTTVALALGLVCAGAFASQPIHPNVSAAQSSTAAADSSHIVVTVRKVYWFKYLDRNHNGQLTRSEIPKDMRDLRRNFIHADFNDNGQLSPMELILYTRGEAPQYIATSHGQIFIYSPGNRRIAASGAGR
jgi:hypothetical protein